MSDVPAAGARLTDLPSRLVVFGFPRWKRPIVRQCFPGRELVFVQEGEPIPPQAPVVLWGTAALPAGIAAGRVIVRLEDGFLRSAGLGADLVRPMSWVADCTGIYYDSSQPSDVERILAGLDVDAALRARAARLRARIVEAGLTKYNVGARQWARPGGNRPVILVPGQVESDASIAWGAPAVRTNIDLLRAVRAANPGAYLVYKPHPDVVARMRLPGNGEERAAESCDEVVVDAYLPDLLDAADEVHVLTSLAGFEALLRGKRVTCHGQPFYSGWGLTHDLVPLARRRRRLSLDELVAGTLIEYPLYLSRDGRRLLSPEAAVEELIEWRLLTGGHEPWWREIHRFFVRRIAGVR